MSDKPTYKELEQRIEQLEQFKADLKKVEQELRDNEEKYRTLFEMESDAIGLIEIDTGQMLEVNKVFVDLYGYTREEILKMKNTDFSAEPEKTTQATRSLSTYIPVRYHKKKDGTVFPTEITASIFKYQGRHVHIAAIRDITERMRLESKLQRAQRMETIGILAGGVAHDLNNVLSGIISYPELLLMQLPEDSNLRSSMEAIRQSGLRAVAIVDDLMTITRGVATRKEPVNLNEVIKEYLRSPEFDSLKRFHPGATFDVQLSGDLFNLNGSLVHIRKALMNLVSNGAEAIEQVGNIIIKTENRYVDIPIKGYDDVIEDEYVVLSVSDNGSGIPADDIEKIFEPFYTKKTLGRSGTGLGLAVVWNVVQSHAGYIDVKSDQNGTFFELYFPITREIIPENGVSVPIENLRGKGEKILVIDDVDVQRKIASRMLGILGYEVDDVPNGEKAIGYLRDHSVDLVLLDMIMEPGINGLETYKKIIKIHPGQKAIIVSGFVETDQVKEAQKLGAGQFIKKPYSLEKIGLAVKAELQK